MSFGLLTRYGLTRAAAGGPPTETVIERAGTLVTPETIGLLNAYQRLSPNSNVTLAGVNDAYQQNTTYTLVLWELGVTGAALASVEVAKAGGVHAGRFSTPVALTSGTVYLLGWTHPSLGVLLSQTSGYSWAGFTTPATLHYTGTPGTYPATTAAGYMMAFDLVILE